MMNFSSMARAETIVATLSKREIAITSTFSGSDIAVFGMIERDATTVARSGNYDVVISVLGPNGNITVRQKERWGPLWINSSQKKYFDVPLYRAILTARPLEDISTETARDRLNIDSSSTQDIDASDDPSDMDRRFSQALRRLQAEKSVFLVRPDAVTMLRPNIFQATIPLPGNAPVGLYIVNVTVLSDGVPLKTIQSGFVVRKVGIDATIASFSRLYPWIYGIFSIFLAIGLGWIANLVFKRD